MRQVGKATPDSNHASRCRPTDFYSACEFVRSGLGIALVPAMGHFLPETLPPVELRPTPPRRHLSVLHWAGNTNPLLAPLIDEIQRAARAVDAWVEAVEFGGARSAADRPGLET